MNNYPYTLEPYGPKSKHKCPECGTPKKFSRYIYVNTGNYIGDNIGRCDREIECGYWLKPKDAGVLPVPNAIREPKPRTPPKPIKYISFDAMSKSLTSYGKNNLVQYLISRFGEADTKFLTDKYKVGTSKFWPGANIFYQIDRDQKVRRGKVMLYDPVTGKRDHTKINSVHALSKLSDHKPAECFFGEHLLTDSSKPIAVCESEKTAIIASHYLPGFIWIASGGLSMLSYEKCQSLKGRDVTLFPDLKAFDAWQDKANLFLSKIAKSWKVSNLLEKVATESERNNGLDLADYLLRYSFSEVNKPNEPESGGCRNYRLEHQPITLNGNASLREPYLVPADILELHKKYTEAEASGLLDDHPDQKYIGSLWRATLMYAKRPEIQSLYIDRLTAIMSRIEDNTTNKLNSLKSA